MSNPDYVALRAACTSCAALVSLNLTSSQKTAYCASLSNTELTRTRKIGCLVLPIGVSWENEHNWHPLRRASDISVSGKIILWEHQLLNGRQIIISSDTTSGWWRPETLPVLNAMASSTGRTFEFMWDSYTATVVFDFTEGDAIELVKVHPNFNYWAGTIRLLAV